MPKIVNYYDYCRQIRSLKETKGIDKSLKFLLLDFADRHGANGIICPSNKTLAEANCIGEKSIEGLLSRARKNKLIKTSRSRKNKPRYVTLLCPIDGSEIFLQICKKNPNFFADTQKDTFYRNGKVINGTSSPFSEKHLPTLWTGFLSGIEKKDAEKFRCYLEFTECDEWLACKDFLEYMQAS